MTEKRFDVVMNEFDEVEYITDIVDCEDRDFADFMEFANEMAKENEQLKQREEILDSMIKTFDEGCREIYDDKCRLEKENEELKLKNELLERDLHYCAKQFKEDVKNILLDLKSGLND